MGRLRLWIIAVVSLIVVTANAWIKQGVGILLCGARLTRKLRKR